MSFQAFKQKAVEYGAATGGLLVAVTNDTDEGKYLADFSDGTRFTGNSISGFITALWGSGHQSMFRA